MRAFVALPLQEGWVAAIGEARRALMTESAGRDLAPERLGEEGQGEARTPTARSELRSEEHRAEKWLAPFRAAAAPSAKWVAPGGLHLTLAFLGELEEALAVPLADRLEAVAGDIGCFSWRMCGCGTFSARGGPAGNRRRGARVLWCAVEGGESLPLLAGEISQACDEVAPGVRDRRPFRPHVTVARCDPPWPASAVARFEARFAALGIGWATAREVVFFRSELRSGGALHTPLRRLRLREVPA